MKNHKITKKTGLEENSGDPQSNSLLTAGCALRSDQVPQGFIQLGLEKEHKFCTTSLDNLCHCLTVLMRKACIFLVWSLNLCCCYLCPWTLILLSRFCEDSGSIFSVISSRTDFYLVSPKTFSSWGWTSPVSLQLINVFMHLVPHIWMQYLLILRVLSRRDIDFPLSTVHASINTAQYADNLYAAWDYSFPGARLCIELFHFMRFLLAISSSPYRSPFNSIFAVLSFSSTLQIVRYETHAVEEAGHF